MRRWPVRSALYIDFENVPLPPEAIANWLAWLEDGVFEPSGRRRRFLQKRVYWNSHAERHRALFEDHGFVPILIGKFSGLKNGADIRMAMDIVETTYTRFEIDEYILLTGDSDFVPVLDRLREKAKRSAIVATEHRPNIHTTYQLHADVLIASRRLTTEAAHYKRVRRSFFARLLGRPTSPLPPAPKTNGAFAEAKAAKALPQPPKPTGKPLLGTSAGPAADSQNDVPALDAALGRVVKLLSQQPRNYMAQRRVLAELDKVQGFRRQGAGAYLGYGSYRTLMRELAGRDARISVVEQPGGGTGVVFIPPDPPAPEMPAKPEPPAVEVAAIAPKTVNGASAAPKQPTEPPPIPPAPRPPQPATAGPET